MEGNKMGESKCRCINVPKSSSFVKDNYYEYWIDIHEMCFDGRMLGTVWGICGKQYDSKNG